MTPNNAVKHRTAIVATTLLAVFFVGMNPPVINIFNRAITVGGFNLLYVWLVVMAVFASGALVWAAYNDAFAITEDQVPPELRDSEAIVTTSGKSDNESPTPARGDQ